MTENLLILTHLPGMLITIVFLLWSRFIVYSTMCGVCMTYNDAQSSHMEVVVKYNELSLVLLPN
jgi:hypothetical protein